MLLMFDGISGTGKDRSGSGRDNKGKGKGNLSLCFLKNVIKTLHWCVLFLNKIVNSCLRIIVKPNLKSSVRENVQSKERK